MNARNIIISGALGISWLLYATVGAAQSTSLQDEFFELLERCDSPTLVERDAAEDELTRRLAKFESIWQDRRFLTNGETSAEGALRFELAEARRLNESIELTRKSFVAQWIVDEPCEDAQGSGLTRRCVVRFDAPKETRIVYLTPKFDEFSYQDEFGRTWRPASLFSSPELTPEKEATSFEIETTLVCDDENVDETLDKTPIARGALETLVGVDARELVLKVVHDVEETETARSGDVVVVGALASSRKSGGRTIEVKIEYDDAFDAFDSHRSWFDLDDFALVDDVNDKRFKPRRLRQRMRTARSVVLEFQFEDEPTLTESIESDRARFVCRIPRCFNVLRVEF